MNIFLSLSSVELNRDIFEIAEPVSIDYANESLVFWFYEISLKAWGYVRDVSESDVDGNDFVSDWGAVHDLVREDVVPFCEGWLFVFVHSIAISSSDD